MASVLLLSISIILLMGENHASQLQLEDSVESLTEVDLLKAKYNSHASLVENIVEENKIKDTKMDALTANVEMLKEENKLKDNKLKFLINQDSLKEKKIRMLENVLINFGNKHKEYANIMHDFTEHLDSQTLHGNSSDSDDNKHQFESDGQEKLITLPRSIQRSIFLIYITKKHSIYLFCLIFFIMLLMS